MILWLTYLNISIKKFNSIIFDFIFSEKNYLSYSDSIDSLIWQKANIIQVFKSSEYLHYIEWMNIEISNYINNFSFQSEMEGQDGTTTRRKRKQDKPNIMDPRSESRKNFTKINIADPRPKLAEIPIKAAKECRQKKFNENRGIGNQEEENEIHIAVNINNKQIIQLVKQLSEALKQFEMISRREIENIKMQMELKINRIKLENDKITKDAESLLHKIEEIKQSVINQEINKTTQK